MKPAFETIILARKPLDGTISANVLKWGCGALNIGASRVGTEGGTRKASFPNKDSVSSYGNGLNGGCEIAPLNAGRYPANVLHDGSPEVVGMFPETTSCKQSSGGHVRNSDKTRGVYSAFQGQQCEGDVLYGDSGSAARFFWSPKAGRDERPEHTTQDGRTVRHPTVKPLALIEYLVRLITPPNGHCLDPYAGSGTTLEACYRLNMRALGIELEADHLPLIAARLEQAMGKHLLPGMD